MTNTDGINHTELGQIYFFHIVLGNKNKICYRQRDRTVSTQCQKAYFKIFIVVKEFIYWKKPQKTTCHPHLKNGTYCKVFQG